MKTMKQWVSVAILILCGITITGCKNNTTNTQPESQTIVENENNVMEEEETLLSAIDRYMVNEIGKHYSQGDVCIPCVTIIGTDESNNDDIKVWGDFWVFNYNQVGDTLKTVSGGDHPGLMHVKKTEEGYEVIAFNAVVDGAGNLESAKKIFGEKYDAFHAINSDDKKREENRMHIITDYVKKHQLPVTMYQDYGWPVIALPLDDKK